MNDIKVTSGRSSMATHRLTQSSTTLNRRYVKRPASLAVEQAAREAAIREAKAKLANQETVAPSRLVNLRVRSADLAAAQAKEAAERAATKIEEAEQTESRGLIMPRVVEYGKDPTTSAEPISEPEVETLAEEMTQEAPTATMTTTAAPELHYVEPEQSPQYTEQLEQPVIEPTPQATQETPEVDTTKLALSIAADYAAASMSASVQEFGNNYQNYAIEQQEMGNGAGNLIPEVPETTPTPIMPMSVVDPEAPQDSVDAIAAAASAAIASIRTATAPAEVSEQVASLKAFAENIKANHSAPEMRELGDTIEKFVSVAMKSSKVQEEVSRKTTKTARAAEKVTKSSAKVMAANHASIAKHGVGIAARSASRKPAPKISPKSYTSAKKSPKKKPTAEELKDQAIRQALRSVATMEDESTGRGHSKKLRRKGNSKRLILAIACAAACVGGVVYFVSTNIPDISIKVAAMQTGVEAVYPSYIPRDYSLADITSENGKITLLFEGPNGTSFTLDEEKSSWDSSALLRNYVEPTWGDNYATTHEQGVTIYISNTTSDAAWVNGGVLYKITSTGTALTKKQVRSIVTSM